MNGSISSARPIVIALVAAGALGAGAVAAGPGASRFPNVTLRTHEGKTVRFYDDLIKGKIVLINFMYVNCDGICPGQTANLVQVQRTLGDRLGRDVFIYSITLDPKRDDPEALTQYARAYRTRPGWSFLTGDPEDIELLRRRLGFVDPDPERDKDRSNHIGVVLIGNEALSRWSACPALSDPSVLLDLVGWMKGPEKTPVANLDKKGGSTPPRCPIDRGRGTIPVTYQGRTYQVCCTGCKEKFEADPGAVLAGVTRKAPE
jgi:protein SCO1/2